MKKTLLVLGLTALLACQAPAATRIALRVPELTGANRDEVVTSGVPLAKGTLPDEKLCRLLNEKGEEMAFVPTVLTRWPDKSVKWLLLDFRAVVEAHGTRNFTLECGVAPRPQFVAQPVTVVEQPNFIQVTTGPLRFNVRRDQYTFLDGAWLAKKDGSFSPRDSLVSPGKGDSRLEVETTPPGPTQEENWLLNAAGGPREQYQAVVTEASVEFQNPLRTVILVRGEYRDKAGKSVAPFWTRYTAWAGATTIGVEHFFAFDADVEKNFLRTLSLGLQFEGRGALKTTFGLAGEEGVSPKGGFAEQSLVEVMPDRFYSLVPLSVDRRVSYQLLGKTGQEEQVLNEGVEAPGWVKLESSRGTTTIALREFPRLHPKEISVQPDQKALRYYLWPERGGKVLDLRRRYKGQQIGHYDTGEWAEAGRGFGKTHQMLIDFSAGKSDGAALAKKADEPLRAFCTPEQYASCNVWPRFLPVDTQRFPNSEALLRLGHEWMLRAPKVFHWDGMVDWGDTLFNAYEVAGHGQVQNVPKTSWVVRGYDGWLNNDCNVSHDMLINFLRSGDDRLYQYFERMVHHVMDVDAIHAGLDKSAVGGGRRHDEQHWGASVEGYGTAAVESAELYCLTGSLWAREMLVVYANWYIAYGGGEWENRTPCLVLAWEITGDDRYMRFLLRPEMKNDVYAFRMGLYGSIDRPHFRTHAVLLGDELLCRATGDKQWTDFLQNATRRFIEENPGNNDGLMLLANDYCETGDKAVLDWMRRLLVVGNPYMRAWQNQFLNANKIPDDLSAMPWDKLEELAKKALLTDIRNPIYGYRAVPYTLAAAAAAGLDEKQMELTDFALDRQGMGQYPLRGPDAPIPADAHYVPVPLASVANTDPLADPFNLYSEWKRHPLQDKELGYDFGDWGPFEPGYFPVRKTTLYPYRNPMPGAAEHDGTNFIGLPFGTTWTINNMPFWLADPTAVPNGKTILIVGKGERIAIPVNMTARKLHVLGHVTLAKSPWKEAGARYHLNYADGTTRTIELTNMEDYDNVFGWGFAKNALFARNWKVQGEWDGGAPILNNYAIPCEEKPLKELVIEDAGQGIGFMILAVTAEAAGAVAEEPALVVPCTAGAQGAAANLWKEGAACGWRDITGRFLQVAGVQGDGSATFRTALKDGTYDVELQMTGNAGYALFNVRANGRRVVNHYVQSNGCIPKVSSRGERVRFPVTVTNGTLDITLEGDTTAGNWRHPARLAALSWALDSIRVFPGTTAPPAARPEFTFGWVEKDLVMLPPSSMAIYWGLMNQGQTIYDARITSAFRCRSPRGTFRADLPPGDYEVDLVFGLRTNTPADKPIKMNVSVQGEKVLTDFDGGFCTSPVIKTVPFHVGAEGCLLVAFESGGGENEWGINAMVVRPRQ